MGSLHTFSSPSVSRRTFQSGRRDRTNQGSVVGSWQPFGIPQEGRKTASTLILPSQLAENHSTSPSSVSFPIDDEPGTTEWGNRSRLTLIAPCAIEPAAWA